MKHLHCFAVSLFLLTMRFSAQGQNVLPDFTVKELAKGKIQISWVNPYANCIQLAIQRSADSTKDFRTIFSSQSPELPSNGFVDNRQTAYGKRYYRIFYVLGGGTYYFTKPIVVEVTVPIVEIPLPKAGPNKNFKKDKDASESTKPKEVVKIYIKKSEVFKLTKEEYSRFRDSINTKTKDALHKINDLAIEWRPAKAVLKKENLVSIYKRNQFFVKLKETDYSKFKDSIATKTKDTLFTIDQWRIQLHPFIPEEKKYIFVYKKDSLVAKFELPFYKRFKDSVASKTKDTLFSIDNNHLEIHTFIPVDRKYIFVYIKDSLVAKLELPFYKKFKDSIATRTKDTLYSIDNNYLTIHPFVPMYVWKPSVYVFTNTKGYVSIMLPLVKQHRYRIIFYDEDSSELFQIKSVKEPELVLDKTNFMHVGWFSFELFEDDKLKEKSKFFLSRD